MLYDISNEIITNYIKSLIIHKSGKLSTILEKHYTLRKKGLSNPKKSEYESPKKSVVSKQTRYVHFATKKKVQFGQFWPQEHHFWSTVTDEI